MSVAESIFADADHRFGSFSVQAGFHHLGHMNDVVAGGQVNAAWGLHLIDVNLVMGDLVNLVGEQSRAWMARKP